ncbi:MAG: ATP-dependent Clp protease ATP-binding subunit [Patescibacteria group bacterium]
MTEYAKIYYFYQILTIKALRVLLLVLLAWLVIITRSQIPIFILSLFLMLEVFFHFKIARLTPPLSVLQNDGKNIYDSFTLEALSIFVSSANINHLIKTLIRKKEIQFILQKGDFTEKEISLLDNVSTEELASQALSLAKNAKGKAVTTADLFAAYILFTEDQTKLLFNKNLKKEEFMQILYWARATFTSEENKKPYRVSFWGEGIGEQWVFGWTIETKKYMLDLTPKVLQEKPMLIGRENEYRQTLDAIYKNKSVILVGEPGSGKASLAETLAFESFVGQIEGNLSHQRFYQLLVDRLLAGSSDQGQLEKRLDSVIAEIAHSGNLIIFIPDIENILGASTFNLNLSGVLIPYLERGIIRIIGTSTPGAYKRFIEPMRSLVDVFGVVKFEDPDKDTALQMLFDKAPDIEKRSNVALTYKAIVAAFNYADKYLQGRVMPGAGVTLLEDTVSMVKIQRKNIVEEQDVIEKVESKTKIAIGVPQAKEKELLLHLEDEIHKRIIDQEEAALAISEGLRRIRAGLQSSIKPISFLFLGPTGVGKTETAKALAYLYFGGEDRMIKVDMSEYSTNEGVKRLLGGLPDEEGLTDKVYEHPFSLILLDEFEKAVPLIHDLFLQVLDDGRLTDNKGRTVSFVNTIIIATSNAASEFIREEIRKGKVIDKKFQADLLEFLQTNNIFKPELLNRFDEIVVFKPLGRNEIVKIVQLMLKELSNKLLEKDITVSFDDKLIAKIVKEGVNEEFGARPLRRFIQDNIEDLIAKKMLQDEIKRGNKILFSTDNANTITITVS